MKRKAVAAVLTAVMVASMFTGCGSDNGSSSAKSASAASAASAANDTVDEDGKVNGIMYQEGLPLVDEGDYTFSIFCDDSSESGEFIMLNEFKKQTNVDVDLKIYPYETATERLNLDLNSGDYADVIGGWTLSDNAILTYGVNQGVFIPLEDYFEKYCPNISAILDLPGVREKNDSTGRTHLHNSVRMCRFNRWIQPIHQYEMAGECWHEHADHYRRV